MDKIPLTPLPAPTLPRPKDTSSVLYKKLLLARRKLALRGFHELITWSFMESEKALLWGFAHLEELVLQNPIHTSLHYMRPSPLPNLLEKISG